MNGRTAKLIRRVCGRIRMDHKFDLDPEGLKLYWSTLSDKGRTACRRDWLRAACGKPSTVGKAVARLVKENSRRLPAEERHFDAMLELARAA